MYRINTILNSSAVLLLRSFEREKSSWNMTCFEHTIITSADIRILRRLPGAPSFLYKSFLLICDLLLITEFCEDIVYLYRIVIWGKIDIHNFISNFYRQFLRSDRISSYYRATILKFEPLRDELLNSLDKVLSAEMYDSKRSKKKFVSYIFDIYANNDKLYHSILEGNITPSSDLLLTLPEDGVESMLYSHSLPDYMYDTMIKYVRKRLVPIRCRSLRPGLLKYWERSYHKNDHLISSLLLYAIEKPLNLDAYKKWRMKLGNNRDLYARLTLKILKLYRKYDQTKTEKLLISILNYREKAVTKEAKDTITIYWELCRWLQANNLRLSNVVIAPRT